MGLSNQIKKTLRDISIVLAASWTIRLAFILIVPENARSFDAFAWQSVANFLNEGQNPYHTTTFLSWPPFWMQVIFCISKVAAFAGIPFFRALQIFMILVESIVIVEAFKLIQELAPAASARNILLFGIALNPVAILLTCQHCNFDVIVGLWVLLFVRSLIKFNRTGGIEYWLGACLFLGLGILTKTVPLILIPMLAGGFRQATKMSGLVGAFLVLAPVTLGMSVIYVQSPGDIAGKVLGYRSMGYAPSFYGVPGLLHFVGADRFLFIQHSAFYGLISICLIVTWNLFWNQRIDERGMVLFPALILLGIPTFGTGFGPQYAYWFLPLLVVSYALYGVQWQRLLISVGFVNACTYIVEYAVLPALGWNILYFFDPQFSPSLNNLFLDPTIANILKQAESEGWQTAMGLPIFITSAVLFLFGFGLLKVGSCLNSKPLIACYSSIAIVIAVCTFSTWKPANAKAEIDPKLDTAMQNAATLHNTAWTLATSPDDGSVNPAKAKAEIEPKLDTAIQNAAALNNVAWTLATSPDDRFRDGKLAVELSRRACELTHYRVTILVGTLAAAYAEAGRFDDAISNAQNACTLASQMNQTNLLERNEKQLDLFRSHRPYRETNSP